MRLLLPKPNSIFLILIPLVFLVTARSINASAEPNPLTGNPVANLLALSGADNLTVELVRGVKKGPDGQLTVVVEDGLRKVLRTELDRTTFRLAGLDGVVETVQGGSLTADGRVIKLSFADPAGAEQARVVIKGYTDLILGIFRGMPPAPSQGMSTWTKMALLGYLGGVRVQTEGKSLRIDLPDPAPVNALLKPAPSAAVPEAEPTAAERCGSNLRTIAGAMELFQMDKPNGPVPTLAQLVADGYLRSQPECPEDGSYVLRSESPARCSVHGTAEEVGKP